MIAVVLAAPDYKARFADAVTLLNYGYANCRLYTDKEEGEIPEIHVAGGVRDTVKARLNGTFSYLSTTGEDFSGIEKSGSLRPIWRPLSTRGILWGICRTGWRERRLDRLT